MEKVGFIGAYDKIDFVLYVAKLLTAVGKKILVVDYTITKKAKYIVPTIKPTLSYITEYEDIDVAIGFENLEEIKKYLGQPIDKELDYDYILIDLDNAEGLEKFELLAGNHNYFVTSFDAYSLKKGLEILQNIKSPIQLTKVIFSKEILKEEDDYLNFLALGYKILWNEYRVYFPLEQGDQSAIIDNQRISRIKFDNLSMQYKESIMYIAEMILKNVGLGKIKKALKDIEKGEL